MCQHKGLHYVRSSALMGGCDCWLEVVRVSTLTLFVLNIGYVSYLVLGNPMLLGSYDQAHYKEKTL